MDFSVPPSNFNPGGSGGKRRVPVTPGSPGVFPPILPSIPKRGKQEGEEGSAITESSSVNGNTVSGGGESSRVLEESPLSLPTTVGSSVKSKTTPKSRTNPPGLKSFGGLGALQWDTSEDLALVSAVEALGTADWTKVAQRVKGRTAQQCMSRWVKALKIGEEKGPWTEEEDAIIREAVARVSGRPTDVCWADVAQQLPGRLGKQCRERWQNRLDPNISKRPFSAEVSG